MTRFPFLDAAEVGDYSGREVPLYLKIFHPRFEDLFFIGLFQPQGCIWPLVRLARAAGGAGAAAAPGSDRRTSTRPSAGSWTARTTHFTESIRHAVEVDYHDYRERLVTEVEGGRAF